MRESGRREGVSVCLTEGGDEGKSNGRTEKKQLATRKIQLHLSFKNLEKHTHIAHASNRNYFENVIKSKQTCLQDSYFN